MCGICGIIGIEKEIGDRELSALRAMREDMYLRGPDDFGEFHDRNAALGFRRLSIVDLEHGRQPMLSEDEQFALVFNGEIYNHPALKADLEKLGERYRTRADTETVLRLSMREWDKTPAKLSGMFAFASYDRREKRVLLARDHFGMKPLYYCQHNGRLYFSSQLMTLLKSGIPARIGPQNLKDYLEYGFSHAPYTVFKDIYKLPAGCMLEVRCGKPFDPLSFRRYYTLTPSDDGITDEREALERLDELLNASVKSHLQSDVPVGSFLSGGVDSSIVTAIMARHYPGKIKTFSIGFTGAGMGVDESVYAAEAARHIGTDHTPIMLPASVLKDTSALLNALDEPIGDSAILPTKLLSEMAKQEVKVVLTGEGADEMFAGYGRYKTACISHRLEKRPAWVRSLAKAYFSRYGKDAFYRSIPELSCQSWLESGKHSPFANISSFMSASARGQIRDSIDLWSRHIEKLEGCNGILATDIRTVLADCLLMKVDKASMCASLEARVPFLTPAMASFALSLDPTFKIRRFKSKMLLRKLSEKYIPRNLAYRRKHGFIVPWESWIRRYPDEVRAALHSPELMEQDVLDIPAIDAAITGAKTSGGDTGLMFRAAIFALWFGRVKEAREKAQP